MYNAARSVVDAMRRSGRGGVSELQRIARELGALSVARPAVEAVLA